MMILYKMENVKHDFCPGSLMTLISSTLAYISNPGNAGSPNRPKS